MADHLDGAGGAGARAEDGRRRQSGRDDAAAADAEPAHGSFPPELWVDPKGFPWKGEFAAAYRVAVVVIVGWAERRASIGRAQP